MRRLAFFGATVLALAACSSASKGEACEDPGRIGGDCESGLVCAHSKADDTSGNVCLKPCVSQDDCGGDEVCNGDRGSSLTACRKR
jgi:hypothetical protein